jgi:dTDP-4-amino-4,6-dideoxygalactose transaminase
MAFKRDTGIPIVIDGAATFESLAGAGGRFTSAVPVCLSFHATKTFATGEGGGVVTTDQEVAAKVGQALNFGFFDDRECRAPSTNGKMSEYHAAVGLAELDGWAEKYGAFAAVADAYRRELAAVALDDRLVCTPSVAGCYVLFRCTTDSESRRVQASLTESDIGFRLWYGGGLLKHRHFDDVARDSCEYTAQLAATTLGLPVATDLSEPAIRRIAAALRRGVDLAL